jgi:polysaccharide deacetylase 2 family uncharacterized protein YibQ
MMSQMIKIRIDKDNEMPFETKVNATDRISIVIDDMGVSVRSDGERLDLAEKSASVETPEVEDFNNQLTLFDSKPWKF